MAALGIVGLIGVLAVSAVTARIFFADKPWVSCFECVDHTPGGGAIVDVGYQEPSRSWWKNTAVIRIQQSADPIPYDNQSRLYHCPTTWFWDLEADCSQSRFRILKESMMRTGACDSYWSQREPTEWENDPTDSTSGKHPRFFKRLLDHARTVCKH